MQTSKTVIACVLSLSILGSCFAQEFAVPEKVQEHTIGVITIENPNAKWIKIEIRRIVREFLSVEKLQVVRLYDGPDGLQRYGFTGPAGEYLVETDIFSENMGFESDQFRVEIFKKDNPDPEPGPGPGPDPDPEPDPEPDPGPEPGPGPDPNYPDDIFDNIGRQIHQIAPNTLRSEYAGEWRSLIDDMERPGGIVRVTEAAERTKEFMARYDSRGWREVNDLIRSNSSGRILSFQGVIDYYTVIWKAVKPL